VTHLLILILVLLGVGVYFMTPAERTRLQQVILAALHKIEDAINLEGLQCDPFFDALRARTARVIATPLLIVLSTIVFVHSPVLDLFVSAVCLWQIGLLLERLVGRMAFITIYVASGVAVAIISLSVSPDDLTVGPSAPVLAMYGLLLVTSIWNMIRRSSLTIPLDVTKRLAPVAAVFVLYKLTTTGLWNGPELAALACGLLGGIVVMRDLNERTPQFRRLATAMATVVAVVTLYSLLAVQRPLKETFDVRPEIDRVLAVENRTARLYDKEVDRFRKGRITVAALTDVIEKAIVPELHVVAGRLRALQDVPPEHQQLIAAARTFLKLRDESWQLRAVALHKSDMLGLRQADSKEEASLAVFHRLRVPLPIEEARVRSEGPLR
jgi:membrane associated rhomboid family serine protease